MLCCICKEKEATVHLTQIAGDKMQKVDLCEDCAKTKGVNDPTGFSLADLLLGLGASQEIEQAAGGAEIKCAHRSEEHTSELQSQSNLVCRLLLEKKKRAGAPASSAGTTTNSGGTRPSHATWST